MKMALPYGKELEVEHSGIVYSVLSNNGPHRHEMGVFSDLDEAIKFAKILVKRFCPEAQDDQIEEVNYLLNGQPDMYAVDIHPYCLYKIIPKRVISKIKEG